MISVIVPAYNEAKKIGYTLQGLCKLKKKGVIGEIIVVDNASKDQTYSTAKKYVQIVYKCSLRGKGATMRFGAQKAKGNWLAFIDASQFEPKDLVKLVEKQKKTNADMVIGLRDFTKIPWQRRINNRWSILAVFLATGRHLHDVLSGYRLIRKKDFLALGTVQNDYRIEAETCYRALLKGMKIAEVPVAVYYDDLPGMRLGSSKAPLSSFLKLRFLHEAWYNLRTVLLIWIFGRP